MFGSLLGKKKDTSSESQIKDRVIVEKIATMNLTDMRTYIKNRIKDFQVCETGTVEVMKRLTSKDETSSKLYINSDDMDSKKKKAFDLVLLIATSKKVSMALVEEIQKFIELYAAMIAEFDRAHKEIYASRLSDALNIVINNVNELSLLQNKMNVLGEK